MADLGSIGDLQAPPLMFSLGREDVVISRTRYPARACLIHDMDLCASLELDWLALAGSINNASSAGVARWVSARHRASGRMLNRVLSTSGSGAFALRVPPGLAVDLHIRADAGDGCDIYLPERTPVDD
ncbi:hypothetical protein [Thiocystis violascens]|uniref:Uncharacterized protein n=1 Tax=Thiocystis violascens (strain ATCC 17096 / DSM 198 / 6111) TaxID=765911 RepID=I3Y8P2_THIV6|nr:hypothetical protein [Thiocystis violascens]AFL73360.1 hypothetical protein Thivi_1347 [Thiocystis violascens DSM 198]